MAEKILNTRLLMKVDTLENWSTSTLKLKKGELAFATVAASAGTGLTEPVVMVKIGTDEEKTFSELPWAFHAKASDVLAACKSEAALKTFINGVIADAGIASSDAMEALAGRVTTAEGEIDALQADLNTAETGLKAKMTAAETAIGDLEGLVGEKAVATQISEAIAALDLANTYEVKGEAAKVQTALDEYKTSNDAAVQKNTADITAEVARAKAAEEANAGAITAIKDGTTIDSFADVEAALAGKQATGDYATKTEAQGYADAKDSAIAEAKKAGTDAAAAAKAAQDGVDALEGLVGETKVSEQISGAIDDLDLANTYAAKSHTHTKAEITDFAHTHEMGEVNGLTDALAGKQAVGDYATKAEAKGYADAKDAAIEAAQAAADKAQGEVDALETYVGTIPEGYTESNVIAYVNKKAQETLETASGGSSESAASVLAALNTYKAENDPKVTANTEAIADLEELVGDTAVATQISTAVATETSAREAADTALGNRVKAIEDDYLKAADKTELEGKITTNANAIERLTNGVSAEEVDGVNDLIQYVKDHGTEVTGIKADIKTNADDIDDLEGRMDTAEGAIATKAAQADLEALTTTVGTKAAQADLEAAVTRIGTVEGKVTTLEGEMDTAQADIEALQTQVGEKSVAEQIETAVAAEAEIARAAEKANAEAIDALEAKEATWDAAVQTVTAGEGLTATKTGTDVAIGFDENTTFIFDCGTSAE